MTHSALEIHDNLTSNTSTLYPTHDDVANIFAISTTDLLMTSMGSLINDLSGSRLSQENTDENHSENDDITTWTANTTSFDDVRGQSTPSPTTDWHIFMYYLIGATGMLDNGLVILIIMLRKSMRRKICNMLIINQSVIDFLASLFLIINSPVVVKMAIPLKILPDFYCRFWANSYLLWSTFGISTLNLILITVERFGEIVYPLKYKVHIISRKALIGIALIWLLGFAIEFGMTGYTSIPIGDTCVLYIAYPSEEVRIFNSVMRYILAIILPVAVMTYCYSRMIHAMREVQPVLQSMSIAERARQERQDKVRRNLLKTMLTVCVAYVMCVGWNQTYFFLINLGVALPFGTPFYNFTVYAQFVNCLINPIIYTAKYREFQLSAKRIFRRCLPSVTTENSDTVPADNTKST